MNDLSRLLTLCGSPTVCPIIMKARTRLALSLKDQQKRQASQLILIKAVLLLQRLEQKKQRHKVKRGRLLSCVTYLVIKAVSVAASSIVQLYSKPASQFIGTAISTLANILSISFPALRRLISRHSQFARSSLVTFSLPEVPY